MSSNPWINHVRKYAKDNNMPYACAITEAGASYKKKEKPKKEVKPALSRSQALKNSNDRDKKRMIDKQIKAIVAMNNKEAQKEINKKVPKRSVVKGASIEKQIKEKYFEKSRREINALVKS
jgi:hypothetical protein